MNAKELYARLLRLDESVQVEVKKGSETGKSVMETICAFSNEPGIVEGYILLGIAQADLFGDYRVEGIRDIDKIQRDIASQCATMFNIPIRPLIKVEEIDGKAVLLIHVRELAPSQKPLYFKAQGLPRGAYRRIGTTDQHCTEEDLERFYSSFDAFEKIVQHDADMSDVDEVAIERYRLLRAKVNPMAEELMFNNEDLLLALGCAKKENGKVYLTNAGLLVFGTSMALRRLMPAVRVDYIRVPGNEWMDDPENRFTTIDMRGALLLLINRIYNAVTADLPNGFMLEEGQLQAQSIGLPSKVLRETLVNALIHRSYKENQPIQVIRYNNRIDIKNPGFSLKPIESFMMPGSELRNPFISSVFHETNLAETKGSGISTVQRLMQEALFAPPMFVSSRERNVFEATILLKGIDEETSSYLAKILTSNADSKTTNSTTNTTTTTIDKKSVIKRKSTRNKIINTTTTTTTTTKTATITTQRVLAEIIQKPTITIDEIAEICELSYYGVYYHIRKLRNKKIIVRVGTSADGYWKVLSIK